MFRPILRTPEEKADVVARWNASDEDFFGAGACHVLAGVFLDTYPAAGFRPLLIQPSAGFRGGHVIVANEKTVFDWRGWSSRDDFLRAYSDSWAAAFPGWSYVLTTISDPNGWESCRTHKHRHPTQFFRDPIPRAKAFLLGFPPPTGPSF